MAIIAVVGSLNMDLVIRSPRQPRLGETLMGRSFGTTGGGKGSNQALACARLGAESHMIGCIGDDDFGLKLRSTLMDGKVHCDHIEISNTAGTGVAVITVTDQGDNTIVLSMGANAFVDASVIRRAADVFKQADAAMFQLEIPLTTVETGLDMARKSGCVTVLAPTPARALSDSIWSLVDYVVMNETELAFYADLGSDSVPDMNLNDLESESDAEFDIDTEFDTDTDSEIPFVYKPKTEEEITLTARNFLSRGVRGVIVTRGSSGGIIVTNNECFAYAPFKVRSVDSTGAGDSFCAALTIGLCDGMTISRASRFASAAGALACTRFGAHPSLPWRHEVEALLERFPEDNADHLTRR
ncbi:ribokinase [Synergistales bacterium]|nr:ribokinase [Synergistales bacterium]